MSKICLSTDVLDELSAKLSTMTNALQDASSALMKLDISNPAGGNLLTKLSNYRFSLLNMTLADECVEVVLKSIGVLTKLAAGKTGDIQNNVLALRQHMEMVHDEIMALINDAVTDPESLAEREANKVANAIEVAEEMFRNVAPPQAHFSVRAGDDFAKNGLYQFGEGLYALLSGDLENMAQSPETRMQYLVDTMMSSCVTGDYTPLSMEDILRYGGDIYSLIPEKALEEILDACGLAEKGIKADCLGAIVSMGSSVVNNFVNYVNQMRMISMMDETAATNMANTFLASDNLEMKSAGLMIKQLAQAGPAERAAIITGRAAAETYMDTGLTGGYAMAMAAIGNTAAKPFTIAIGAATAVNDITMNTSNTAQLTNNMIYSAEAAHQTYDVFQRDYAAYKENPTEANLNKAMASYQAYNNAIAASYDSHAAYTSNASDSIAGRLTMDETSRGADEIANRSANTYRQRANQMQAYQQTLNK